MGGKGGRRGIRGIMISTHNVAWISREGNIAQRRQVVTLIASYYTDGQ